VIIAVLDTNTIVSATIVSVGISGQILDAARAGQFSHITSAPIVAEVARNLAHPRIRGKYHLTEADIARIVTYLRDHAGFTRITQPVQGAATHPEDDLILATAVSANADYLVTGDSKLQALGSYEGVKIISPRQFLDILRLEQNEE
jgi:putative PIN family toxin of toxin-antitoxin system